MWDGTSLPHLSFADSLPCRLTAFAIFLHAQLPRRMQRAAQRILVRNRKPDVRRAVASPSAVNRQKQIRPLGEKLRLRLPA